MIVRRIAEHDCARCECSAEYEMCDQFGAPFAWYCELCRLGAISDWRMHRAQHSTDARALAHWAQHERALRDKLRTQSSDGSEAAVTGEAQQ